MRLEELYLLCRVEMEDVEKFISLFRSCSMENRKLSDFSRLSEIPLERLVILSKLLESLGLIRNNQGRLTLLFPGYCFLASNHLERRRLIGHILRGKDYASDLALLLRRHGGSFPERDLDQRMKSLFPEIKPSSLLLELSTTGRESPRVEQPERSLKLSFQ